MGLAAGALLVIGLVFIGAGVLLFCFLRGLSRGTVDARWAFGFSEADLEQLKQRAEFGAHWVVGTSFVVTGGVLIWLAVAPG